MVFSPPRDTFTRHLIISREQSRANSLSTDTTESVAVVVCGHRHRGSNDVLMTEIQHTTLSSCWWWWGLGFDLNEAFIPRAISDEPLVLHHRTQPPAPQHARSNGIAWIEQRRVPQIGCGPYFVDNLFLVATSYPHNGGTTETTHKQCSIFFVDNGQKRVQYTDGIPAIIGYPFFP